MKKRSPLLIIGVLAGGVTVLCLLCLVFYIFVSRPARELADEREQKFDGLLALCESGSGVAGAGIYDETAGLHPILVIENEGDEWVKQFSSYPDEWEPADLATTHLVACIDEMALELIESCEYYDEDSSGNLVGSPSYVERYQYNQKIVLYEARTGNVIGKEAFSGTVPDVCDDQVTFSDDNEVIREEGSRVDEDVIVEWLQSYVQLP